MDNGKLHDIVTDALANLPQLQTFIISRFGPNSTWIDDAYQYIKSTTIPDRLNTLLVRDLAYTGIVNHPIFQFGMVPKFPYGMISSFLNDQVLSTALKELPITQVPGYKDNVDQIHRQIGEKNISLEKQVKILQLALLITLAELERRDKDSEDNESTLTAKHSDVEYNETVSISSTGEGVVNDAPPQQYAARRPRTGRPKMKYDKQRFRRIVLSLCNKENLQHQDGTPNIRAIAEELKTSKHEDICQMSLSSLRNRVTEVVNSRQS